LSRSPFLRSSEDLRSRCLLVTDLASGELYPLLVQKLVVSTAESDVGFTQVLDPVLERLYLVTLGSGLFTSAGSSVLEPDQILLLDRDDDVGGVESIGLCNVKEQESGKLRRMELTRSPPSLSSSTAYEQAVYRRVKLTVDEEPCSAFDIVQNPPEWKASVTRETGRSRY
jgi:hypothetical protein